MISSSVAALLVASFVPLQAAQSSAKAAAVKAPSASAISAPITAASTLATIERVADWQLANPPKQPDKRRPVVGWVQAVGYTGIMAVADVSKDPRFLEAMMKMGRDNKWQPHERMYHADDYCVSQVYAELYMRKPDPAMLAPTIERFEYIMAHPKNISLEFDKEKNPNHLDRWSWCDALYMAPTAWARVAAATGKKEYLEYAVDNWWKTSDYLYDKEAHLYYRDDRFFADKQREPNGEKIFWSRGNGWVVGGLVRMLQYLPADHPSRPKFIQQFQEMAAAVAAAQQPDGLWHASVLDPQSYPLKETSGSALFTYGLTWGINQGILDRATYEPVVRKAWEALTACITPEGKVTHVQPIGYDPRNFPDDSTEPFGSGAVMLAGSEIYRLLKAEGK